MSDLPKIKVEQLVKAVNLAESNGPKKDFETLCIFIANGSWAQTLDDVEEGVIAELIIHHKVATKTRKPGDPEPVKVDPPKPEPIKVATTVETVSANILAPTDAASIKTYDVGGKGKKQCPNCNKYLGLRATMCVCGHSFEKKVAPAKTPVMASAVEEDEPDTEETSSKPSQSNFGRARGAYRETISTPSGDCPVKLTGTDEASVKKWAEAVRSHYAVKSQFVTVEGLRYFARNYYNINSPEFRVVKSCLLDIYGED